MKEKINSLMKNGTKMRFSLRKLSIGVCSVILGLTFIESTTQNVDADTNVQSDATEQVKSVSLATSTTNSENNQAKDQESSIDQDKQNSQSTDSDESRSLVDEKSNNLDESTLKNDTGQEKSYFDETAKNGSLNQEKVEQTSTTDNSSELSAKLEKNNANQDSQVLNTESVKVKTTYNKGVTQSNLYATMLYATSYSDNTWHYNGDTWSYSKGDGTQANTEWVVATDGKWYYFDEDGEMAHDGWEDTRLHDGSWEKYYFDSNGHYAVNTWHYNGDTWSYSKGDGTQANTEWVVAPDGKWYYFDEDGEMAHDGWEDTRLHDGSWNKYYFDSNGHYNNTNNSGNQPQSVNSPWHYDGTNWTYSKGDGRQASDEWVIAPDGQWYYFESDGEMAHDGWVDTNCKDGWYSYYFDHNGHYAVSAWHQDTDGTWTYSKGDGRQASDEWVIAPDGQWYYFESDGEMAHDGWVDTRLHDGSWVKYYFDHNGHYAVNDKRKALIDAQNALSELKGKIKGNELAVGGASGFFKEIAENPNMSEDQKNDARAAYAIVNGELDVPSWYDKDVNLGQSNDATSVKNFYATLPYYDQYVKIRQKYNLSVPKVSLADVAVAMMDADYSTHVVDHARHYNTSENLAWNCADDPNGIWMSEESIWNKAVKKNPSLAQYKNDGYGLYQADSELFEQVGHYLNLIDPSTSSYGYALNTESHDYDNTESWDSGYGDPVFSVDEFKKLVTDYYNKMELPDQVKAAQAKVNKAKKDLA